MLRSTGYWADDSMIASGTNSPPGRDIYSDSN